MIFLQHSVRKPSGYFTITDPDAPMIEGETLSCRHCQAIWRVQPGSGIRRGWCHRCAGPLCGKPACLAECVPWERAIEAMEGRAALYRAMDRVIE